ncbi:S8 family serine peptidase [Oceanithermus sp.]
MRRLSLLLLLLLNACNSGLPQAPDFLRLGYDGRGQINLPVADDTVWSLEQGGLQVFPQQGIGPATIRLQANGKELPDQPQIVYHLTWGGDLHGNLNVTWPLVHVTGQVVEPVTTTATIPATGLAIAKEKPQTTKRVIVRYRSASVAPQGTTAAGTPELRLLESSDPEGLLKELARDPNVLWAELDGQVHALGEPADQYYPLEWHLRKTGARWAYLANYANPVTVAVIDTGVRYDHPDLAGRLWGSADGAYDFVEADPDPTDPDDVNNPSFGSHGTHVTGIITARSGINQLPPSCYDAEGNPICSESGVVGLTWPAPVTVLPLRVLDSSGNGNFSAVAAAIRYAAGLPVSWNGVTLTNPHPASVINLSLGGPAYSQAMCEAVADATEAGALVVAAAGNSGESAYFYPASCPGAISVAATDNSNGNPLPTWYSEHNEQVDISAPGGDTNQDADGDGYPDGVLSTTWNYQEGRPNYAFYMGTSQASPQVAAALALLVAGGQTPAEAWEKLKASATDLGQPGRDDYYGYGFLNLPKALSLTLPPGPYRLHFSGPTDRWIGTDANGSFSTYLPSGSYRLTACRDDSQNGFCDSGEPARQSDAEIEPRPEQNLPPLRLKYP